MAKKADRPTPRYGHDKIKMVRNDSARGKYGVCAFTAVGEFTWSMDKKGRRSLVVALPTSKDPAHFAACAWTIDHKNHCDASWSWNGDKVKPSLTPSLHWVGVWHGHVTDGELVEA